MSALFKLLRVLTTALAFALLAVYPHVPGLVRTAGASSVLLTIPFELPDRGGSAYVTLLEGDTVESSVDRFFQDYDVGRTYYTPVLNEVKRRAMKARLMPVLAVPLAPTPGAPAAFTVELFDGEDVAAKARQTAEVQRLAPEEVKAVAEAVVRRAVDVGLLPVLSVDIDLEDPLPSPPAKRPPPLALYKRDNLTRAVEDYSALHGLDEARSRRVMAIVERYAKAKGLIPVLRINALLQPKGAPEPSPFAIDFMEGEDLGETIAMYAAELDLTPESARDLERAALSKALEARLLPVLGVPISLDGANSTLSLYRGDLPETAVRRFTALHGLNLTAGDEARVAEEVRKAAVIARVFPALQLEVTAAGHGEPLRFELFKGDDVEAAVTQFVQRYALTPPDAQQLRALVTERAALRGLVPAMAVPVRIDQEEHVLELFRGDNITEAVHRFSQAAHLDPDQARRLEAAVLQKATAERMVPALSLAVQVRGRRALISLYEGDAAEGVVRRFAEEHALTAEEAAEVLAAVRLKVQQSRMAPVLSLPVTLEAAARFIERHKLDYDLEAFVQEVQRMATFGPGEGEGEGLGVARVGEGEGAPMKL